MTKHKANAEQNANPAEHPGDSVNGWHDRVWRTNSGDEGKDEGNASLSPLNNDGNRVLNVMEFQYVTRSGK